MVGQSAGCIHTSLAFTCASGLFTYLHGLSTGKPSRCNDCYHSLNNGAFIRVGID
jgi:hypothetical protein